MTDTHAAVVTGLTHRYGDIVALRDVSLAIAPGEVVALLGPNGAGKTTLVHVLLGLLTPTEGTATLWGAAPTAIEARRRVGAMLQVSGVPATLTVRETLSQFAAYYGRDGIAAGLLAATGTDSFAERRFATLSGGQRQRALFALAICGDPDLLVLDEPTVGLDVEARRAFWRGVRDLLRRGCGVLVTTHYIEEADAIADRIVVLKGGRVRCDAPPAELKERFGVSRLEDAYVALTGGSDGEAVCA
jgi:ABC-2 type transport system ATP-binding protein